MLRIQICWHFENEQPVMCGYNTLTTILIMQIEKHGRFNYHGLHHQYPVITVSLLTYLHSHIYSTYLPIMLDSPQTPADITNSNSIPGSLGKHIIIRHWRDMGRQISELASCSNKLKTKQKKNCLNTYIHHSVTYTLVSVGNNDLGFLKMYSEELILIQGWAII